MKEIFKIAERKPTLYEQSPHNIWDDDYVSRGMLKAHLDTGLDSATRNLDYVKESAAWIAGLLPPKEYPALLDLGCGPGIYAEFFCERGYKVTGIDLSARSIEYAKHSASDKKLDINYIQGDYTAMDFPGKYHLVTMIYCDFGVLSHTIRERLLSEICRALLPTGTFLFDVFTPEQYRYDEEKKDWNMDEDGFWNKGQCLALHSFYRYDEDNTFLNQYITASEQNIRHYNVWEHTFTPDELTKNLKAAGFRQIEFYKNVAGDKCKEGDTTICVLARK